MSDFFDLDAKIKEKYMYEYNTGYFQTPTKDHFRILTRSYALPELKVDKLQSWLEIKMNKSSLILSKLMDRIMINMTSILSNEVFHLGENQKATLTTGGHKLYNKVLMEVLILIIMRMFQNLIGPDY
jgi:hypothetical protein